jgi:hypothetical protein
MAVFVDTNRRTGYIYRIIYIILANLHIFANIRLFRNRFTNTNTAQICADSQFGSLAIERWWANHGKLREGRNIWIKFRLIAWMYVCMFKRIKDSIMTIFSLDENRVLQGQLCRGRQRMSSLGRESWKQIDLCVCLNLQTYGRSWTIYLETIFNLSISRQMVQLRP